MNWKHEPGRMYAFDENNELLAEVTYFHSGEDTVVIDHTFVAPALRGRGIAGKMMETFALHLRKNSLRAGATCPFAYEWLKRNKERYPDIVCIDLDEDK